MPFNYDKLWEKLKINNLTKDSLRANCGISPNTIASMSQNNPVSLDVIDRICTFLRCDYKDILTYIPSGVNKVVFAGDIWWSDISLRYGDEEQNVRPVLILKVIKDNAICAPLSTATNRIIPAIHFILEPEISGLDKKTKVMLDYVQVISTTRLTKQAGKLSKDLIREIKQSFITFFEN